MKRPVRGVIVAALVLVAGIACGGPAPAAQSPTAQSPVLEGCPVFPIDNVWNVPVDTLPVDARSSAYVASIGADDDFHPDFGSDPTYGIPYVVVPASHATVPVTFDYDDESDAGPYPIPSNPPIEAGGDRHILIVRQGECKLYELYAARRASGAWQAGSGAIFDLRANALRTDGWTSADAAGLPILPGLARLAEVEAGEITHALRFTAENTRKAHIWPARHDASDITDPNVPPMGQRFRLKAGFDISGFPPDAQVILRALKKYGMILADNGSNWFVSGETNTSWDDDVLNTLKDLRGADFEAVDTSSLIVDPNSARVELDRKDVTPRAVWQGQQATYTIQFAGAGAAMTLSDPLPSGITLVAGPTTAPASVPPAVSSGGIISWSGSPAVSVLVQISYTIQVDTAATARLLNTAILARPGGQKQLAVSMIANPIQHFLPLARR
jgi:hypothetical protein